MEANDFVARLKANGSENDLCDLAKVVEEHKLILSKLPSKDRGCFCLNVLSILCRNIEKVPTWKDKIDPKLLLSLSIDCIRETRTMERGHRVKTLACVFHLHRFIVRLKTPIVPEMVLKLSYMPFEYESKDMLTEHAKTYCSILVDRVTYMQLLKAGKMAIIKLLPKLTEDILKVIQIYDTAQFCINALTFLIKNLNFLYNDRYSTDLNKVFGQIFNSISTKSDLNCFKKLTERECMDLYLKLNDCFYVLVENSSRINFKDSILNSVIHTYISMLGHCPDIFYCFQTFYSNIFCNIFTNNNNTNYNETIFNSLLLSCENTDSLGHTKIMLITLPFINQLLRFYIDYLTANVKNWTDVMTEQCQKNYLKIILLIMKKSKKFNQLVKCDNCTIKSGLHDALRLSFLSIQFVKQSNLDDILQLFTSIIIEQHLIIKELKSQNCKNYEKYYKKLQIDIHNTAIILNKSKKYEFSIKLFNIYLENEIINFKEQTDLKNISRALFNKSICELDCKNYEDALKNAFLSLVFAYPESLNSDKYVSLVMDIKAKSLKASEEDDDENKIQMVSVLDVCEMCMENGLYGNLKQFFVPLKFSVLLKHEFSIYAKLWPAVVPISGVWKSLYELVCNKHNWVSVENTDTLLSTLYDIIVETSTVVRSMNNDHYKSVVDQLVDNFDETPPKTTEMQLIQAAMLFLKAEFDLRDASEKYGWKITETITDPDEILPTRTISQEFEATRRAIQAVNIMTEILPDIAKVEVTNRLQIILELAEIFVQQLLQLYRRRHALQLAYVCCVLAEHVGNKISYIRNAGVLLSHADRQTDKLDAIIMKVNYQKLLTDENSIDAALGFICDVAIYKIRTGAIGTAAKLIQIAQSQILKSYEDYPEINLSLSLGRLMEAQCVIEGTGSTSLSLASSVHRHYMAVSKVGPTRHTTRLISLTLRTRITSSSLLAVRCARALLLRRRARAWSLAAVTSRCAIAQGEVACGDVDCVTLDNRLKYILGMQINENTNLTRETAFKTEVFTPKQDVEIMLENFTFKKTQVSPSLPCTTIPGFKTPEFLKHSDKCDCYACDIPICYILAASTIGWEAVMYFKAKENDIARNYFDGASVCFKLAERKLMGFDDRQCEKFIVNAVKKDYMLQLKRYEVEILIEKALFELSLKNYEKTDAIIVEIHEVMQDYDVGAYLKNDVLNLMVASAELRRDVKKTVDTSLEAEFELLKLSPAKEVELQKTPEVKAKAPPKIQKVTVKNEELPIKRKVIKLNLDETAEEKETMPKKKSEFKIPVPVTKHVLENITPRNTRSRPNILVTQAQLDVKTPGNEFSTPVAATPDEFFTPMSTIRTYSKKSLRQNIVKNLENEFSTPKGGETTSEKLEVPKSKVKDKSMLKRATSPGKLVKKVQTRSTRKPQIKFNVNDDK